MKQVTDYNNQVAKALSDQGIKQYLVNQQQKGLLRLLTCGSVDDGKSTLIGRMLHDCAQIYEDQLASIKHDSAKVGTTGDDIDLALLVDGLQAEREQGITIDVAYRYFSSEKRKFIIADTPGHEQYTRNMATGASTCELAIILIDARYGVQSQTRRHAFIAALLGIRHFVVAINKMDLVAFDEQTFTKICADFAALSEALPHDQLDIHYVPVSALRGDNVVNVSENMPWYQGKSLLSLLETINTQSQQHDSPLRFPVQYVNRPNLDFRGFAGTVAAGSLSIGQKVVALPSGKTSEIDQIVTFDGNKQTAQAGEAITLTLKDEIDISRGDLLVSENDRPLLGNKLKLDLVWMDESPLNVNQLYDVKIAGKKTQAKVVNIDYLLDVNSYEKKAYQTDDKIVLNTIARVSLMLTEAIAVDPYNKSKETGSLILIDRLTNGTVAAGMIIRSTQADINKKNYSNKELALNAYVREYYPHWQAIDISKLNNSD